MKMLLYCTKAKPYLNDYRYVEFCNKYVVMNTKVEDVNCNGKIVAECEFEVEEIKHTYLSSFHSQYCIRYSTNTLNEEELSRKSCLKQYSCNEDEETLCNYLGENDGYAIHIKNLKERVMELSDVDKYDNSYDNMFGWIAEESEKYTPLYKAPQNMCRVWIYENGKWVMYILISVRPEWICKILNGEKTIEVRRKVLKGMLGNDK